MIQFTNQSDEAACPLGRRALPARATRHARRGDAGAGAGRARAARGGGRLSLREGEVRRPEVFLHPHHAPG